MSALSQLLPDELRAKAAFELFASSTVSRYARVARSFSTEVARRASFMGVSIRELITLADQLWRMLVTVEQRAEKEVDLALLLSALGSAADPRVDALLQRIGLVDTRGAAWVAALARVLANQRASNDTRTRIGEGLSDRSAAPRAQEAQAFQTIQLAGTEPPQPQSQASNISLQAA